MNEVVERKLKGDQVTLDILRNKKKESHTLVLQPLQASRIHARRYGEKPRFVFFAGLTFQPLDRNLYAAFQFSNPRVRKIYSSYVSEALFKEREDVVIITRVESDRLTNYISAYKGSVVDSVNGEPVNSLRELHDLLHRPAPPEFFVLRCNGVSRPIVIPSSQVPAANQRIMATYGITQSVNLEK